MALESSSHRIPSVCRPPAPCTRAASHGPPRAELRASSALEALGGTLGTALGLGTRVGLSELGGESLEDELGPVELQPGEPDVGGENEDVARRGVHGRGAAERGERVAPVAERLDRPVEGSEDEEEDAEYDAQSLV